MNRYKVNYLQTSSRVVTMDPIIEEIITRLTPGNYWLTKSMEFNRSGTSGTLWYLKKWITYYKFIFLNEDLHLENYNQISQIFEEFVASLPEHVQDDANAFFFFYDIRDPNNFQTFQHFITEQPDFQNEQEQRRFILLAKKFYFMYIMNLGGQAGYKLMTKELIVAGNTFQSTLNQVREQMILDGRTHADFETNIKSDFHAAIRNERQIYFYYGLFHGKQEKSLNGFYNLTPVGKSILQLNFSELVLLWEHQKIKMTSQSPVSDIRNLQPHDNAEHFAINYHPYFNLLKAIDSLEGLPYSHFKYGISRSTSNTNMDHLIHVLLNHPDDYIDIARQQIEAFNRPRDEEDEDYQKELKKYLLGVFHMQRDQNANPFCFLQLQEGADISILDQNKITFTVNVYGRIVSYLDDKYEDEYTSFNEATTQIYNARMNNVDYQIPNQVRYEWAKYNINLENIVMLYLLYWGICCRVNQFNFQLTITQINDQYNTFQRIITKLRYSRSKFVDLMSEIQRCLIQEEIFTLLEGEEDRYALVDPDDFHAEVAIDNLQQLSLIALQENGYDALHRRRSNSLIRSLKTFYINHYGDENDLIPCECCSETTFMNTNNLPYLEYHHLIPFSTDNGPDHYLNLYGLCSNCHSKMHHLRFDLKGGLYTALNENNHFQISYQDRLEALYNDGFLEAIHLDYLLKEEIIPNEVYDDFMSRRNPVA